MKRYDRITIRFKKTIQFPRFTMNAGETWTYENGRALVARTEAIRNGERFAFAGGQCLAQDVEILS